jgi:hypothetical protein
MVTQQTPKFQDCQRIQVAKEVQGASKVLKISVERYDEKLGWYTAGSLSFPLHQMPLLQQALEEMNCTDCVECLDQACHGKIISFPMVVAEREPDLIGN